MSSNPTGTVNTVVIRRQPGLIFVTTAEPKPAPDRIEFFLRRTIEDWLRAHPNLVIDRSKTVVEDGEMLGINVWYHAATGQPESLHPTSPAPATLTISVHPSIVQKFAKEYIEAVIDGTLNANAPAQHPQDTFIFINPRRIAVILERQAGQGVVVPFELVEPTLEAEVRGKLQAWVASRSSSFSSSFYVVHIPGSWFSRHHSRLTSDWPGA